MKKNQLLLIPLLVFLGGCAAVAPGNDPVIVNAERTISDARSSFDLLQKTEYETYPALKAANPTAAAQIRTFTNKVRVGQQAWLQTATDLKNAYQANKNDQTKSDLERALSVLTTATAEATKYIAAMSMTHSWMSYQLANHIGERK